MCGGRMNKKLKCTNGFCNLLTNYTGGSNSYSYELHCIIHAKRYPDLDNPRQWVKYPIVVDVSELLWKDLILTMKEVIENDNKRDRKIAYAMLRQLKDTKDE